MIKKIIISNKFKKHMEVHEGDFKIQYMNLIKEFESSDEFQNSSDDFIVTTKEFGQIVGLEKVVKLLPEEKIIYAKRKGRDIYSKFVQRDEKCIYTNKVVFILNRNKNNPKEYYMVTMFPGSGSEKEPEDKSIKDIEELEKCLDFWEDRAFIFEEDLIQMDTMTTKLPYRYLYDRLNPILLCYRVKGVLKCKSYCDDTPVLGFYTDSNPNIVLMDTPAYIVNKEYYYQLEFMQINNEELFKIKVSICDDDNNTKIALHNYYFKSNCGEYFDEDFYTILSRSTNYILMMIGNRAFNKELLDLYNQKLIS